MKFIADFHIHSKYSIATSKFLIPEYLEYWARLKGIDVIGTGDCIHPGWLNELTEKLEPADEGLYKLKSEYRLPESKILDSKENFRPVSFMLTTEISNIYKKNDKTRKVHNICVFPDFESVLTLQSKLDEIGNIKSDGRPILGLDSKILLEMLLESRDTAYLIPAHIWTPWFSVLGSKSGFNSIEECYEDLTDHIFAVETGLSTDPPMNWTCSILDKFRLVSNSDAHSPDKLGREANLFNTEKTYSGIYKALRDDRGFEGTIEFFPQEGKYHYDGHRKCQTCWNPLDTIKNNGICPVCGRQVTKGVMYRIAELADRSPDNIPDKNQTYHSITRLPDIICEILEMKSSKSKKVENEYLNLLNSIGPEFDILLKEDISNIKQIGGEIIGEAVYRLRNGNVIIEEGYDGEFGKVKLFNPGEMKEISGNSLFGISTAKSRYTYSTSVKFDINEFKKYIKESINSPLSDNELKEAESKENYTIFNEEQRVGIYHDNKPCIVIAGPGSGKTRVLTERIKRLCSDKTDIDGTILALTFSNKAADEIHERIKSIGTNNLVVSTFHSFGLSILKEFFKEADLKENFSIADGEEINKLMQFVMDNKKKTGKLSSAIYDFKNLKDVSPELKEKVVLFNQKLKDINAIDLNDLIYLPYLLLRDNENVRMTISERYKKILIDEFQDINKVQYELIKLVAGNNNPDLFVIGDPDQAIYGFRGAENRFIEKFREDYPDYRQIHLRKGYRCPDTVIRTGSQVLGKDYEKELKNNGLKIHVRENNTDRSEADWIAETIEKMIGGVRSFSRDSGITDGFEIGEKGFADFAVLCRSSFMFDSFIEAFNDHGISYQLVNTDPFYMEEPYKEVISLFKDILLKRNIEIQTTVDLSETFKMIEANKSISDILDFLMIPAGAEQNERLKLRLFANKYNNNYRKFIESITLRKGVDDYEKNSESVSLMTLHSSKGLEFPVVFIPGCEDGIIPFTLFGKRPDEEIKEEKRLFYVGITRTKEELFLSYSHKRHYKNRTMTQKKSHFIEGLEKSIIVNETRESRQESPDSGQLELF